MSARLFCAWLAMTAGSASAFESVCFQYPDPTLEPAALRTTAAPSCEPAAGPNTARQRWVGNLDEHRALWEATRVRARLPDALAGNFTLPVFTSQGTVAVGNQEVPSLVPVEFAAAERLQLRTFSLGELTQLPDFSYALWDWATGHETCPLGAVGVDAEKCHDFASHMGPVNSNHFLPQAGAFYAHYHALALGRAAACRRLGDALGAHAARFSAYVRACEVQALALEAVGQHYLQDAWSSGHMWERWGAPDLSGFEGAGTEDQRERAVLVALVAGLIHGARGVLQKAPEWSGYDVNDALCAPHPAVELVAHDGQRAAAVGDHYAQRLDEPGLQRQRFFACAVSGMRQVYEATSRAHGPLAEPVGDVSVDPVGAGCFGQRITNRALLTAMGIQFRVSGRQVDLPLDGRTVGFIIPRVAQQTGGVAVESRLKNRFRLELMRMVSVARVVATDAPEGTELATGRLRSFLGAQPNGAHLIQEGVPLASYLDPPLPWPEPAGAAPLEAVRARALARTFHRAHAEEFCQRTGEADLALLRQRAQAQAGTDLAQGACGACSEVIVRHLRVGAPGAHDGAREPLCHFLGPAGAAAYAYQPGAAGDAVEALAKAWCGC
jgi:hypothetical protein